MSKTFDISLKFVIGIKDPVHGIILLTRPEYDITSSPYFDRLRYVRKSGLAHLVYPSHNSTRYEHSLGTMQISYLIARNALELYLRRARKKWRDEWSDEYSVSQVIQIVRLGALLHDIGHGPFSHTSEYVLKNVIEKYYPGELEEASRLGFTRMHEYFSFKLILEEKTIRETIENWGINPLDVASLLSKVIPNEKKMHLKPQAWNVLRKIIDSQIDADRLDNLLRDSYGMGVPYGVVDVDNLVKNIHITKIKNNELGIVVHIRALGAVEDMLDARYKMYRWLYYHQRINLLDTIVSELMQKMIDDKLIEPSRFHYTRFVENDYSYLDDQEILRKLIEAYNTNKDEYYLLKGLFNQEYLPLPLWRSYEEYVAIIESLLADENPYIVAKKIAENFRSSEFLTEFKNIVKDKVGDMNFITITREPTTPYDWRKGEEVYIYISPKRIVRMVDISIYIRKLLEMSEDYIHFYLYYYGKEAKRSDIIKLKPRIEKIFIEFLKSHIDEVLGKRK